MEELTARITVVRCDDWPVVGCGYGRDDLVAVVVANRVVAASELAQTHKVTAGLRRREAQRRAPGLKIVAPDPAAEARAFAPVLAALDDITPRIEIDRPGHCAFLTRGPSRYFGGDQAMSDRTVAAVVDALGETTAVRVGTADSRFAAVQASRRTQPDSTLVIPAGASAAFLAGLAIGALAPDQIEPAQRRAFDDLIDVLNRLGIHTIGAFAGLSSRDVLARFGAVGERAHLWAQGLDDRPASPTDPDPALTVSVGLDPPVGRVDQAAFVARALAEDFLRLLAGRGASCARIEISAETENGEQQVRLWRSEEAFTVGAIAERMRWQIDGWLGGPTNQRPTSGLIRLSLRPDDLSVAAGRQLGFWGEQSDQAERAARAAARVKGLVGPNAVLVAEVRGGRSPAQAVAPIPAESVDLVERASAVDRQVGAELGSGQDATAGVVAGDVDPMAPWLGAVPAPVPARLCLPPLTAALLDEAGDTVRVSGRGLLLHRPSTVTVEGYRPIPIRAWSGPWLLDEQWWLTTRRRRARMQVVLDDDRALLLCCERAQWHVEAIYD